MTPGQNIIWVKILSDTGSGQGCTLLIRAAEDRARWKGAVAKSSLVPQ